jgi:hypothetical protein
MPGLFSAQLDDEVLMDMSVPISGINNSLPPSAIGQVLAADAENRLTQLEALNHPRPGIQRQKQTTASLTSMHHLGGGQFLVQDAANWYTYDSRSNVLTARTGGPAFTGQDQVYSALCDLNLYFSKGANLYKYDPAANAFSTITLPVPWPTASFPVWACNRLIYAWKNTIVCSDILTPEHVDQPTGSVTIDPVASDQITGLALWQNQKIAMFRAGSVWLADSGPGLAVPDWTMNRVSGKVGCRVHGSIVQCGADLYFLSETGRGIYAMSQAPQSEQEGVWIPISADVNDYINRINWAACDNVRAVYWNDLYLISLPLDGATFNNFILVYSVTLNKWQGLWCFDVGSVDVAARDFAIDKTNSNGTVLLVGTTDGIISRMTYPQELQFFDLNIDGSINYFSSHLLSRAFTFGEQINRIRPHSVRIQFLASEDPCDLTVIADRTIELAHRTVDTSGYKLQLTIPGFPFDLDRAGFAIDPIGLLKSGLCHELQVYMEGTGNWTVYRIQAAAFEASPQIAA